MILIYALLNPVLLVLLALSVISVATFVRICPGESRKLVALYLVALLLVTSFLYGNIVGCQNCLDTQRHEAIGLGFGERLPDGNFQWRTNNVYN